MGTNFVLANLVGKTVSPTGDDKEKDDESKQMVKIIFLRNDLIFSRK